ncbi:uncharacterized protein LOC109862979 [Pseudomyrmex gracilis]|uniref:uncharacterized protein LOC109862979 n=1 Tax=Pseudomyrmex gracilis TaxID=219809 RepID=UPI0009952667|nr:uncharacterized protein LOC109862979 [Pseudomyrmex gracilis]
MVKLVVPRVHWTRFVSLQCLSAKPKTILNDKTLNLISNNGLKYRHHPGIVKPRTPVFSSWTSMEIENILKGALTTSESSEFLQQKMDEQCTTVDTSDERSLEENE